MRTLAAIFLFVLPAVAADTSVSGDWNVDGDVQGHPVKEVCTLKQDGNKLTGACKTSEKTRDITGQVNGAKVTFSHAGEYNGDPLTITFSGSIGEDGDMKGSIDVDPYGATGDFVAKKSTPTAARRLLDGDYVQSSRTVNALDARHLNIGRS